MPIQQVIPEVPSFLGEKIDSIEEAQNRVDFPILKPDRLPQGYEFLGADTSLPSADRVVQYSRLVYSNGKSRIIIGQGFADHSQIPPLTDEFLAEYRQQRVTVQGYAGMGHERETRQVTHEPAPGPEGIKGEPIAVTVEEPAALVWWPPEQEASVWTDDLSLTLADLISVAESMEPAQ